MVPSAVVARVAVSAITLPVRSGVRGSPWSALVSASAVWMSAP